MRACTARSCRKPRNGARPVPAQTITIGVSGEAGGWKWSFDERTATATRVPGEQLARYVDAMPW